VATGGFQIGLVYCDVEDVGKDDCWYYAEYRADLTCSFEIEGLVIITVALFMV
jgi:hypothetical protein